MGERVLKRSYDLAILGAGIYGVTAAFEASRRGYSVLVVDRGDIGGGASSNSMKIAHGGLRYLQSLDLARSLESIRERRRLILLAPELVRPLRCRMDTSRRGVLYRAALGGGMLFNELLSLRRNRGVPKPQALPRALYPIWYDALIEDTERLMIDFLHTAVERNPGDVEVQNHTAVVRELCRNGKLVALDLDGIGEVEVGALVRCIGASRPSQPVILSLNLVVDQLPLNADGTAVGFAHPDDGRNVFCVPWRGRSIVGTYDRDYPFDPTEPLRVEDEWIDELLTWLRAAHPDLTRLERRDIRFVHAGKLPRDDRAASSPSERATIRRLDDGSIDVQGVKWTPAYGVSSRALDLALPKGEAGVPEIGARALLDRGELLRDYLRENPEAGEGLPGCARELTRAEVLFCVEREWARGLDDVLLRRTGLATAGHPGSALVEAVSRVLQEALDWSDRERRDQVEAFDASFHFAGNVPVG